MNLLPYLHNLTVELVGLQVCPHCGQEDLFFANGLIEPEGSCTECKKPIPKHKTVDNFIYALSVLYEFISKYDELMPAMHKTLILNELHKDITYSKTNRSLPDKERLYKLKTFFTTGGYIGSKKYGASITVSAGQPNMDFKWELENPMERIKSITAVGSSLIFLTKL